MSVIVDLCYHLDKSIIPVGSSPENYSDQFCECSDIIRHRARADRLHGNYNSFTVIGLLKGHQ